MRILRKAKSIMSVPFQKSVRAVRFRLQALYVGDRMVSACALDLKNCREGRIRMKPYNDLTEQEAAEMEEMTL